LVWQVSNLAILAEQNQFVFPIEIMHFAFSAQLRVEGAPLKPAAAPFHSGDAKNAWLVAVLE
jgi:hypothetical protein